MLQILLRTARQPFIIKDRHVLAFTETPVTEKLVEPVSTLRVCCSLYDDHLVMRKFETFPGPSEQA